MKTNLPKVADAQLAIKMRSLESRSKFELNLTLTMSCTKLNQKRVLTKKTRKDLQSHIVSQTFISAM